MSPEYPYPKLHEDSYELESSITAEQMWVKVTQIGGSCIVGKLDSSPQFTKCLKSGDEIHFHPKPIVRF